MQYALHFRNYDPSSATSLSRDPAEDDLNLYRYVKNNPINQEDPSGLEGPPLIQPFTSSDKEWLESELNERIDNGVERSKQQSEEFNRLKEENAQARFRTQLESYGVGSRQHAREERSQELTEQRIEDLQNSAANIFVGDMAEAEMTPTGAIGSVVFGLTGLDVYKDYLDMAHLLANWEGSQEDYRNFMYNAVGFLPVVGATKNVRNLNRLGVADDAAADAAKLGSNVAENTKSVDNVGDIASESSVVPGSAARRPGGYHTGDTDAHGLLSPGVNRAPGHTNTRGDGFVQSHHGIQRQWANRNVNGYDEGAAPAVLLKSRSGEVHANISAAQRARRHQPGGWDTDIRTEFNLSYREMIDSGLSPKDAQRVIKQNYKYFDSIGAFK